MATPEIQVLLNIRTELSKEIDRLKDMIARLEQHIETLDAQIARSSFTTADAVLPAASRTTPPPEREMSTSETQSITLVNKAGNLELGTIEILEQSLRVIPAEHAIYDITRGAFARFFVERILGKYQQEDRHRVENGEIEWDDAFDFEVKAEDNILDEMIIRNFGDESRFLDIQNALRWALEKTYSAR
ncbi:hypothetical protein EU527_06580 [Candidatus Thorarchaeota archaeon]|nr:MAG: hypothetical protein EU527_06580 [Candidatus Thorarchaeota archaeon]